MFMHTNKNKYTTHNFKNRYHYQGTFHSINTPVNVLISKET